MNGGLKRPGKSYYDALANSPFGNEILLQLAKDAIVAEKLGQDDVPDLLSVSFSSNDLIGHSWGPDSHEVFDITLRSDRLIAELIARLDRDVGAGNYTLIVTADHGVCPLPELAARLANCCGFVGHDSGITHLAAAVGLPGVVLWGASVETVWRPRSERIRRPLVRHGPRWHRPSGLTPG